MFDIYGVIDLLGKRRVAQATSPFSRYEYYDFAYAEHSLRMDNALFFYLERKSNVSNYFCRSRRHVFIYGFAFGIAPTHDPGCKSGSTRLGAADVFGLYEEHGTECAHRMKGSYCILIYDERENKIVIISDHLNVLPVYYACRNGIFVVSSAQKPILDSSLIDRKIDRTAIAEFTVFDHTLGERTFYDEIKQVDHAQILMVDSTGVRKIKYFSIPDLFQEKRCSRAEGLEILGEILRNNSSLYVAGADRFLLALTGGFDCRMNLSLMTRDKDDYLCYSYGMPGSRQLEIPSRIAQALGLNYTPVLLDDDFERDYEDCALRALFYSDGTAPILRANYPYAYRRLNAFADVAVTGLFGSEIMRPIRNLGIQINKDSERIFMCDDFEGALRSVLEKRKMEGYVRDDLLDGSFAEVRDHLKERYFLSGGADKRLLSLYGYFLEEGMRKYFMQEIRIERIYVETRFPFFDIEFVKAIFRTPYAGLYNGALRESPVGRRNAQALYAHVINNHKPVLGRMKVDRGYRPADLLSPLWFLRILPGYVKAKMYYRKKGDDTFAAERWTGPMFSRKIGLMRKNTEVFSGGLYDRYETGAHITDNYRFSRIFSLKYWFEHEGYGA